VAISATSSRESGSTTTGGADQIERQLVVRQSWAFAISNRGYLSSLDGNTCPVQFFAMRAPADTNPSKGSNRCGLLKFRTRRNLKTVSTEAQDFVRSRTAL
jgi:hypothetical protein